MTETKIQDYAICYPCGVKEYGKQKEGDMEGITVWVDICPICKEKKTVIPRRDFNSAPWNWD